MPSNGKSNLERFIAVCKQNVTGKYRLDFLLESSINDEPHLGKTDKYLR